MTTYKTTKQKVAEIREELKKEFPKVKFSIRKEDHRGVRIAVLKSHIDFGRISYMNINDYYPENGLETEEQKSFIKKVVEIAKKQVTRYYETGDYGTQPDFYTWITVGEYDKPHEYVKDYKKSELVAWD
jgi:hypothetical protein